jgi:hypothetical protein
MRFNGTSSRTQTTTTADDDEVYIVAPDGWRDMSPSQQDGWLDNWEANRAGGAR